MHNIKNVARKEFASFFSTPAAFIFFGAFLVVNLFVFFWVETFFSRNIADMRPLFQWMPVLLIFLVAALTMRMWSEERRGGTLEFLLTAPVSTLDYVLGKFLACMALVAVALLLTLPLPVTVSFLGPLDWGPVLGAYLATLFLAAAYTAIGLFVSARSENQIVSLIVTVLICSFFYLLGSEGLTSLFGNQAGEYLKLLGSGSRFESITRGVIDLRDLYYYISIVGIFLTLNVFALEKIRWAGQKGQPNHTRWKVLTGLFIANFLAGNIWLQQISSARVDITQGQVYSISDATKSYLNQLREPLLIRGYFSAQTHPLLAPLVPQLRDLIEEYSVAGEGKIRVEFIDPLENPELEQEAGEKYGIRPEPLQTASKYQAGIVNSYFDILVQYGDQYETLSFRDLIDVKVHNEMELEVALRNPEYDITRAIKKVLYGYQGAGNLFANIASPVQFQGYISPDDTLPEPLIELRKKLLNVLSKLEASSDGKLNINFDDPEANGGALAQQLEAQYGFRPMAIDLFNPDSFWFYMTLESGGKVVQVPLPEGLDEGGMERALEASLKHFASGFLKTVAINAPEAVNPMMAQFGMAQGSNKRFEQLTLSLQGNSTLDHTDLKSGQVSESADLLLMLSPGEMDEKQLFAVDQFLMKGGTVILAASPFDIKMEGVISAVPNDSKVVEWLKHHGIDLKKQMVLDPQNSAFPIPVQRNLGGFMVQEIQMVNYPYFVDIRDDGMNSQSGLTAGIPQVTMNWPSPIELNDEKNSSRQVTRLLESTDDAWASDSLDIQPDFETYPEMGFAVGSEKGKQLLAVAVEGQFESYFKGQPSPLLGSDDSNEEESSEPVVVGSVIEKSPESARIILFSSSTFVTDEMLDLAMNTTRTPYVNTIQLMENAIDWSLEDRGLLSIRSRGHFARILDPIEKDKQVYWEYLNYAAALVGLLVVYLLYWRSRRRLTASYQQLLSGEEVK
ncbi:MAG TPA: ABC transporter permease [Gammaproteobacteria bacterium]|nr:ABC transporter permease [Gammaproteobacteria bacterium]